MHQLCDCARMAKRHEKRSHVGAVKRVVVLCLGHCMQLCGVPVPVGNGDVEWQGKVFSIVDTGGVVLGDTDEITQQVRAQAQLAIDEADVIVMLGDILDGVTSEDREVADVLRRTDKPIILVVNKADNLKREMDIHEFYALGLGEPLAISAERGLASGDLLDQIVAALPELPEEGEGDEALHVAIVGRTNVGKSSLLNRLLGVDRTIVSDVAGTTRDAIDSSLRYHDRDLVLIDTAGIRRRARWSKASRSIVCCARCARSPAAHPRCRGPYR